MGLYKDKSNAGVYGDSSIRSSTRFILRNAWNSNNIVGVNNKKRAIGSFRATLNAGDLLSRQNYSCGGPNPLQSLFSSINNTARKDSMPNNCDKSGVPPSACNVKFVYDSSDFTRFRKHTAINRTYSKV